jgi:hypothetical protein
MRKVNEFEFREYTSNVQRWGDSLLYWVPRRLITCPKITKLAARSGVGATIVQHILQRVLDYRCPTGIKNQSALTGSEKGSS